MKHLASLKGQLKEMLATAGPSVTITSLRDQLPDSSPKYNLLLQLQASFQEWEVCALTLKVLVCYPVAPNNPQVSFSRTSFSG